MTRVILFVEDDPDDWELTLIYLRAEGFEHDIRWVRGGAEALEHLREAARGRHPMPAMVITDFKMPKMTGLELLQAIRADPSLRGIPVVFLTSSGDDRDRDRALALGAKLYLRKPERFEEFRGVIARLQDALRSLAK